MLLTNRAALGPLAAAAAPTANLSPHVAGSGGPHIPLLLAVLVFALAAMALNMYRGVREGRERHATLRALIEKGQPLPPELLVSRERSDLRRGIVLVSIGIGLAAFLFLMGNRVWPVGIMLLVMGGGYLIAWRLREHKPGPTTPEA